MATFLPPPLLPRQQPRNRLSTTCHLGPRTLGVDYGLRHTGLAVSVGISPRPLTPLSHASNAAATAQLVAEAARSALCEDVVVGLPLDARGAFTEQAEATAEFVAALCPLVPWARVFQLDERYTTLEARSRVRGHGRVDSVAAGVLLERYFSTLDETRATLIQPRTGAALISACDDAPAQGWAEWRREMVDRARS